MFLSDEAFLHVVRTIPRVSGLGNAQVSSLRMPAYSSGKVSISVALLRLIHVVTGG